MSALDLESFANPFILETKKITIPGHPHAFNSSIVEWKGLKLLSFREIPFSAATCPCPIHSSSLSRIGIVKLKSDFSLDGEAQMLNLPGSYIGGKLHARAEDARLFTINDNLYIIFSDNPHEIITEGGFRLYVGELDYDGNQFFLVSLECMKHFPGENSNRREKNWVPFDFKGHLLLGYSLVPHRILHPFLDQSGQCEFWASSSSNISWEWGELRGGTPALAYEEGYLAFFHSSIDMASEHSNGEVMPHYFMGAYTFQNEPPFAIQTMSPEPIIGKDFYHGIIYPYYWKPVRVVFPCGFLIDGDYIWLSYGRQDHEIWVAKIDKAALLSSLRPVSIP